MIEIILLIILSLIVIGTLIVLIIRFYAHFIAHKIKLNRAMLIILICLGFGIFYDSLRSLSFLIFGNFIEIADLVSFFMKIFLLLVGLSAVIHLLLIQHRLTGHEVKYASYIRIFYYSSTGILTIIAGATLADIEISGLTFYAYQIPFYVALLIVLCYVPLILWIGIKQRSQRKITNKRLARQIKTLGIILLILISERVISLFLPFSTLSLIIQFSILTMICFIILYSFIKYPAFWDEITSYFNIQAVFIIKKNDGNLLFQHNLWDEANEHSLNAKIFLLGSLVHAINWGFEKTLIGVGKLDTITIGDKKMMIEEGQYVIGMIFVTEDIELMKTKLVSFIQQFENHFEPVFQNWKGNLTEFTREEPHHWVEQIFR